MSFKFYFATVCVRIKNPLYGNTQVQMWVHVDQPFCLTECSTDASTLGAIIADLVTLSVTT